MYSTKLLMMGREDARNMYNFITELIWIISVSGSVLTSTRVTTFQYFQYVLPGTQNNKRTGQNFLLTNQLTNQVTDELKKLMEFLT